MLVDIVMIMGRGAVVSPLTFCIIDADAGPSGKQGHCGLFTALLPGAILKLDYIEGHVGCDNGEE